MDTAIRYLIGIDGGGTRTRALVRRLDGSAVGRGEAGPSALGQGIAQAWRHIVRAVHAAFAAGRQDAPRWEHCAMVAALSGAAHAPWHAAFLAQDPGLARLAAEPDSLALLLGAHGGKPGAIVIAGTGSVAEALLPGGGRASAGGWGFPLGDEGSGAWLGMQAVRHAQCAFDGRAAAGALARHVRAHCGGTAEALQGWCAQAGQFDYAGLAPAVFECESADGVAAAILQDGVAALEALARAVDPAGRLPLALGGSVAKRLAPHLDAALRARLVPPQGGALDGALTLATELALRPVQHGELEETT
jgi:glucosamine kinase